SLYKDYVFFAGITLQIHYTDVQNVTINAGQGNDKLDVRTTDAAVNLTINGGGGADTVNIGKQNLFGIFGTLYVTGGTGTDALNVNDCTGTDSNRYRVYSDKTIVDVQDGPPYFTVNYSDTESLTINGGKGADLYFVYGSSAAMPIGLNGGDGLDNFLVGEGAP